MSLGLCKTFDYNRNTLCIHYSEIIFAWYSRLALFRQILTYFSTMFRQIYPSLWEFTDTLKLDKSQNPMLIAQQLASTAMFTLLLDWCKTLNFAKSLGKKYLLKINGSTRRRYDICWKLPTKNTRTTLMVPFYCFIANFELVLPCTNFYFVDIEQLNFDTWFCAGLLWM